MAIPSKKSNQMTGIIDDYTSAAFGKSRVESIENDICVFCHNLAVKFRDKLSEKEFTISGLCQKCQDSVFSDEEE